MLVKQFSPCLLLRLFHCSSTPCSAALYHNCACLQLLLQGLIFPDHQDPSMIHFRTKDSENMKKMTNKDFRFMMMIYCYDMVAGAKVGV